LVRWAAPAGGNGAPVTDYVVTPYLGSSALASRVAPLGTTSTVVPGLVNGKTYRFRVSARTEHGTGPAAGPTNAITIGVPTAPLNVTAVARAGKAAVRWQAPSTTNGSAITAYVVTPYRNGVAVSARVLSGHATSAEIAGLTPGQSYTFRVAAENHRGTGPQSSASSAVVARASRFAELVQLLLSWLG
jgi:large repetitive protein